MIFGNTKPHHLMKYALFTEKCYPGHLEGKGLDGVCSDW